MNAQKSNGVKSILVILSLLLGQRLAYGQHLNFVQQVSGAGVAAYWSYIPVAPRYSFTPSRGELDPTFDGDGIVLRFSYGANAVVLQPDGKILVSTPYSLSRFNPDGIWDISFNAGATVPPSSSSRDIVLQEDGKIVEARFMYPPVAPTYDFALARYNSDGSLDTSFDGDGWLTTDINGGYDDVDSVTLQPDGQILLVGSSSDPVTYQSELALARYNPDGSLDLDFGNNGIVLSDFGIPDYWNSLALQSDGKILAVGAMKTSDNYDFALARYHPDGSLDTSFDGDGLVTTDFFGDDDIARDVLLQPDGKIVVAGDAVMDGMYDYEALFALARYNPDGSLDTSFGGESSGDGKVATYCTGIGGHGNALALQPDGKIVVASDAVIAVGYMWAETYEIVLLRYNPDGSLDPTFDGDGWLTFGFDGESVSANAIVLQPDGKIVVAGRAGESFVLLRFK